jgi:hypothetical protein
MMSRIQKDQWSSKNARFKWLSRCFLLPALALALVSAPVTTQSADGEGYRPGGVLLSLDFDGGDAQQGRFRTAAGAGIVNGGHTGNALRLPGRAHAEAPAPPGMSAEGGTVSFRVRPLWKKGDRVSRTFLSLRWGDGRDSYLAVSRGWWEPTGTGKLYFILSNQEIMHCSLPYEFETDSWTHITVTWQGGRDGYCRLFLDGEKAAEHRAPFSGRYAPKGPLYLGSDKGSTVARSRESGFLLDDLAVLDRPLAETEVLRFYEASEPLRDEARRKKRRQLDSLLAGTWETPLPRNGRGAPLERRVLFDEDIRWALSRDATDAIVSRMSRAGFNVYVPCVWHGRGTHYPSPRAHQDRRVAARIAAGDDPLRYLLAKAHAAGIEVHPWFTVARREDDRYRAFHGPGVPDSAFDVHNPEFRAFIVGLMTDLVERYPVDGVNLDYIRTMGDCVCASCGSDYRRRYGRELAEDLKPARAKGKRVESLEKWHGEAVSEIVREFSTRAKRLRPGLVVSVDAHPLNPDLAAQGQDSIAWVKNGWVDAVFAMDYGETPDVDAIHRARAVLGNPAALTPLFSTYDTRIRGLTPRYERNRIRGSLGERLVVAREPSLLTDLILVSRRLWPGSGIAFYHEKRLTDEQVEEIGRGVFTERALPAWASAPAREVRAR